MRHFRLRGASGVAERGNLIDLAVFLGIIMRHFRL